jgi:hypothetical protein
VRGYRADLRRYVVPALGGHRVSHLRRRDVQELLVDDLVAKGKSSSKVLNVLNALRATSARRPEDAGADTGDQDRQVERVLEAERR